MFNRNSKSIFVLENERELYSINMDDSGFAKKRVNTFVSEKEIILDITDYGDFCILKTEVRKNEQAKDVGGSMPGFIKWVILSLTQNLKLRY